MFKQEIKMDQVKKANDEAYFWYAVYTKPRWEKKVAERLLEKGIDHYCPLNKVIRQWSDRKKAILEPIFKGYVFVRTPEKKVGTQKNSRYH